MRIAIYSRGLEADQQNGLKLLLSELALYKIEPVIFQDFFNQIYSTINCGDKYSTFNCSEDLVEDIDCIISLGGDGTLLDTVTLVRDTGIPVLGINYGRLGFLASIGKDELHTAVEALVKRTYMLDKRTLLHLDANMPLFDKVPYALNEITIHKKDTSTHDKNSYLSKWGIFKYLLGRWFNCCNTNWFYRLLFKL
ncbi:MAG: NAD(+)/NADH kinase [Chitinophagaceae bacterium]